MIIVYVYVFDDVNFGRDSWGTDSTQTPDTQSYYNISSINEEQIDTSIRRSYFYYTDGSSSCCVVGIKM